MFLECSLFVQRLREGYATLWLQNQGEHVGLDVLLMLQKSGKVVGETLRQIELSEKEVRYGIEQSTQLLQSSENAKFYFLSFCSCSHKHLFSLFRPHRMRTHRPLLRWSLRSPYYPMRREILVGAYSTDHIGLCTCM